MTDSEKRLFLQALAEDGVDCLYVQRSPKVATVVPHAGPSNSRDELMALRDQVLKCEKCPELVSNRNHVVFGSGNIKADLMFVGEAPGRDEDLQGLPFVGRAGQLLTKIIESIGLARRQVFIANTLKCRPPGNRAPKPEEVLHCESYLNQQIDWIQPKIICALGNFAAQSLLKTGQSISHLRGRFHEYRNGIKVMCTYHPAYLLRNPDDKRKVWEDMIKVRNELKKLA